MKPNNIYNKRCWIVWWTQSTYKIKDTFAAYPNPKPETLKETINSIAAQYKHNDIVVLLKVDEEYTIQTIIDYDTALRINKLNQL
jgi:hypothetical protein